MLCELPATEVELPGQVSQEMDATDDAYVLLGHSVHTVLPVRLAYVPAPQF